MLIKDKFCLESILEAIDRIQEYVSDFGIDAEEVWQIINRKMPEFKSAIQYNIHAA